VKVLITNAQLGPYCGTEVVVRDLALELRRQGHQPMVYSPRLGAAAEEIRSAGIEVQNQVANLSATPDIIHGHHHPVMMQALLQFSSTPAIHVCHGAFGFMEAPFYFPRILRYMAVDNRCRKRIQELPEIPPERIAVMLNAVDLTRFRQRDSLPARPRRALLFSNYAHRSTHLPAVRKACHKSGLCLDVVGLRSGNTVENPAGLLPAYDIVFAKARCALEAMAVGTAVVLCDAMGAGPMVTTGNLDVLRPMNFGGGVLTNPLRPECLTAEIERYDPQDAAAVSDRVRNEAGLVESTHRWINLYSEVIEEFRASPQNPHEERRAVADYLAKWSYSNRVGWEIEQLRKLKAIPVIGRSLGYLAGRILRKWVNPTGD
jgi:hypothetical protein